MPPDRLRSQRKDSESHPRGWLQCPVCHETFRRTEHLNRHQRKHTGEKPFSCPLCRKAFNRADSLKRHELLHAPRDQHGLDAAVDPVSAPAAEPDSAALRHPDTGQGQPPAGWAHPVPFMTDPGPSSLAQDPWASMTMDPAVMSNTNWLPLVETTDYDWNPLNLFLDSSFLSPDMPGPTDAIGPLEASVTTQPVARTARATYGSSLAMHSPAESQVLTNDSPQSSGPPGLSMDLSPSAPTYVDSGVTRLAKGRKRTTSVHNGPSPSQHLTQPCKSRFGFPNPSPHDDSLETPPYIQPSTYEAMQTAFEKTCSDAQSVFEPFASSDFPTSNDVNRLIGLAVAIFLPSLPFVNPSMLRQGSWILYLALTTVGSHYETNIAECKVCSLTEFLRRVLLLTGEAFAPPSSDLELVQAKLLLCICLMYSGRKSYCDKGRVILGDICRYCRLEDDLQVEQGPLELESRIRTKHAIWLVDCMSAYQHDMQPVLAIEDGAETPLPVADPVWESLAETPDQPRSAVGQTPSLRNAIRDLYLEKKVHPAVGEFGRILLIHALFHQTWHVGKTCRSTLSSWEPKEKSLGLSPSMSRSGQEEEWAPVNQTFSRWRNAACDCIDVLHWHANSQIGANSGNEHPTVFFLHFSRVVLLTPVEKIRDFVSGLTESRLMTRPQAESANNEIFRWAHKDCHKARLAVIHAGVLLYHVRRHSIDSFYEPNAVFSAILSLWAYGCAHQQSVSKSASRAMSPAVDEALPSFIHLDRPCDDELVQLFIKNGNRIMPNVTGVGDICAMGGPKKVLQLGCHLLSTYGKNWDLRGRHVSTLTKLQAKTNLFDMAVRQS